MEMPETKYTVCVGVCIPVRTSIVKLIQPVIPKSDLSKITVFSIGSIAGSLVVKHYFLNFTPAGLVIGAVGGIIGIKSLAKLCETTVKMTIRRIKEHSEALKDIRVINDIAKNKGEVLLWDEWDKQYLLIEEIINEKRGVENGVSNIV